MEPSHNLDPDISGKADIRLVPQGRTYVVVRQMAVRWRAMHFPFTPTGLSYLAFGLESNSWYEGWTTIYFSEGPWAPVAAYSGECEVILLQEW